MKFKSKISFWLFVPIYALLLGNFGFLLFQQMWGTATFLLLVILFVSSLFLNTYYEVDEKLGSLKIVSGFIINKIIYIENIQKIKKTSSLLSSPALSLTDRIEIFYNKFDSIIISPKNQEEFLKQLKNINPNIEINI